MSHFICSQLCNESWLTLSKALTQAKKNTPDIWHWYKIATNVTYCWMHMHIFYLKRNFQLKLHTTHRFSFESGCISADLSFSTKRIYINIYIYLYIYMSERLVWSHAITYIIPCVWFPSGLITQYLPLRTLMGMLEAVGLAVFAIWNNTSVQKLPMAFHVVTWKFKNDNVYIR